LPIGCTLNNPDDGRFGTPLLVLLAGADESIGPVNERLIVSDRWNNAMTTARIDLVILRIFLIDHEDFLLRLMETR
jgi:hypothetical protein